MKKIKNILLALAVGLSTVACADLQEQPNAPVKNMLYIDQAVTSRVATETVFIEWNQTEFPVSINPRLAVAHEQDIAVSVKIDTALLATYNATLDGEPYKLITEANESNKSITCESVEIPDSIFIEKGQIAVPINMLVKSKFDNDKEFDYTAPIGRYALPLSITSTDLETATNTSHYILFLEYEQKPEDELKPFDLNVAFFQGTQGQFNACKALGNWDYALTALTIEWWSNIGNPTNPNDGYTCNNQLIFSCGNDATTGMYCRFGDLNGPSQEKLTPKYMHMGSDGGALNKGPMSYNYLQMKAMGGQFDSGTNGITAHKWDHWAITFEVTGENKDDENAIGKIIMYRNGEKVGELDTAKGKMFLTYFQLFNGDSNKWWGVDWCGLFEFRIWKTCRTQKEIKENMYFPIRRRFYKEMVAYWPMNEGSGTTLKDVTGNGHDFPLGSIGGKNTPHSYQHWAVENKGTDEDPQYELVKK